MSEMQRVSLSAKARRGSQARRVAQYLAGLGTEEGATVVWAMSAPAKRGGVVKVILDAEDAVAVARALRTKLDAETNGYATDVMDELVMGAFASDRGHVLWFANENYRVWREEA